MDNLEKAKALLQEVERQLRDLIADAAANSQYDDLPALAQIAGVISKLSGPENQPLVGHTLKPEQLAREEVEATKKFNIADGRKLSAKSSENEFPRFEVDGNRLVKLGWSSRDKCIYEHRVEREIVRAICDCLIQKAGAKKPFKMEKLFPMHSADGVEIPSYKAYLVLKWLQHFNVIERKGKDGYIFLDKKFYFDVVDDLWKKTTQRSER